VTTATISDGSLPNQSELESFVRGAQASLRVCTRAQLLTWTQGPMQDLIKHELLICALRDGEPPAFHVDLFAKPPAEPGRIGNLLQRDASMVPYLVRTWESNFFRPVALAAEAGSQFAQSPLARELDGLEAHLVLVHGTVDAHGQAESLFAFACRTEAVGPRHAVFADLLVPFLHQAWMRTRLKLTAPDGIDAGPASAVLTSREQEILGWIHGGKSNIEIGFILGISPLTVKNHVQKILSKLNVRNRAQAVGKGLALRILRF
jgi:transcriptional regulator EpsA